MADPLGAAVPIPVDAPEELRERFIAALAARTEYQLSYHRAPKRREFHEWGLDGPLIDNAYTDPDSDHEASGDWDDPELLHSPLTEQGVFARFFSMAVNEAVHEALEWFRIDGQIVLDPHGQHESTIFKVVGEMIDGLWSLRTGVGGEAGTS